MFHAPSALSYSRDPSISRTAFGRVAKGACRMIVAACCLFAAWVAGTGANAQQTLLATNSVWAYRKGTSEASTPVEAWRLAEFDDASWSRGAAPFYYDTDNVYTGNTVLSDMRNGYTSVYLRQTMRVGDVAGLGSVRLRFFCDDGFVLWANGVLVTNFNKTGADFAFNALSTSSPTEPLEWVEYTLPRPEVWLKTGDNQVAVQAFNTSRTSSDFVFMLEIQASARDLAAPTIRKITPEPGSVVGSLGSVTVQFSEPVTGIGFSDLLVNRRPAVGLSGGGDTYTFVIDPPAYGDVAISWDSSAGITDLGNPANTFDAGAPGATWTYRLVDSSAPTALEITPAPGNTVRELTQVEVRFSEPVVGVDAADLIVGGRPAASVTGSGAGPYVFRLAEPAGSGEVALEWAAGHGITDGAPAPNAFAGGRWSQVVDPAFSYHPVRLNEILTGYAGDAGLRDEDDELQDWIELHNRGTTEVNLRGWALTDDPGEPGKWVFPDARIAPGGFLIVFASAKDRRPAEASGRLHANFKLGSEGEYLGLYDAASPRAKVSEFAPGYPLQRNDVSYGPDARERLGYFSRPTPGAANGTSDLEGVLPPVDFNVSRGLFERPFELHLSTPVAGARIRYTTDGSEPTATTGAEYAGPIQVAGTSIFRAAAFKAGSLPSVSVTHTYIFPAQVARQPALPRGVPDRWIDTQGRTWTADYEMDPEIVDAPAYRDQIVPALKALPVLSIVARPGDMFDNSTGIYPKSQARGPSWERPASAEFIDWERGETVQANCGVQMQGNSVRDPVKTGKHAFRLVFKGDYGPAKLRYRVFPDGPLEEFDTLTVRADFNNSWMHWNGEQRPRGIRIRDAWMKESQRTMGGLASHSRFFHLYVNGLYWGVYDAIERPDSAFAAAYFGGAKEDYDVVNEGSIVDGNMTAYNTMRALTGLETAAGYARMKEYLDVPAYIDYLLLHFYVGHEDWFTDKNWYACRKRVPGAGFRYQAWDGELMLNSPSQNVVTRTDQPSGLHPKLLTNAQYRLDFADRVQRHFFLGGALTPSAAIARLERWASMLDLAMVAESARWGDYRRDVHPYSSGPYVLYTRDGQFRGELQRLRSQYFPGRTATVLAQLKAAGLYPVNAAAPVFNAHGGRVAAGFGLTMSAPSGILYFTLDGSDPRVPNAGGVAPTARVYQGPVVLEASATVKARTLLGNEWSALSEADFDIGPPEAAIAISEIHYHPVEGEPYEFLELVNHGRLAMDVAGFSFDGISYVFPPGSVLEPGRVVVLASELSPGSFAARYPGTTVYGRFAGTLSDGGERIALKDRAGRVVTAVSFDDEGGWAREADGAGASLERLDPRSDPNAPANWRASTVAGGTPGVATFVGTPPPPAGVRLNEVSAVDGDAAPDWIELHNAGAAAIDLGGWSLSDGSDPRRFVFPAGVRLDGGAFLVVPCRARTNAPPGASLEAGFALDRAGETVSLFDASSRRVDVVTFGPQVEGHAVGRLGADGAWNLCVPTPGKANEARELAGTGAGVVSINEFLAAPVAGADDWIELFNADASRPAAVGDFRIGTSNAVARVTSLSFIAPGGFLVLAADGSPGGAHLDLRLPATGGVIALTDATGTERDRIVYAAQAVGASFGRLPDGGAVLESFVGSVSPGVANHRPEYQGPVLNEIMAWNVSPLPDAPAQAVAGWVELHHSGADTASLAGMSLQFGGDNGRRWTFPAGAELPAGGHVVVRFDAGLPASSAAGARFSAGFPLEREGGTLTLFDARGRQVDAVEFGFQVRGLSIGRTAGSWGLLSAPTPATPNAGAAALGSIEVVRINEFLATSLVGPDWIELCNPGDLPIRLGGAGLADDPSLAGTVGLARFPELSFIGARGFVQVTADGRRGAGSRHVGFQLGAGGEAVLLVDAAGRVIDEVYFGRQQPDVSLGRLPDGAAVAFRPFANPTPGRGNADLPPAPPSIESIRPAGESLVLRITGEAGVEYELETSTDLLRWDATGDTLRPAASPFEWSVRPASGEVATFFRLVRRP